MMSGHTVFLKKYLWKIKVPLKIRIFIWFLYRKVILTKDNLTKRGWTGCTKCVFCGTQETSDHLFLSCSFARLVWRVVHFTYNIPPPTNVNNLFGNWLNEIDKKQRPKSEWGFVLWFGQFGIVEMMLCLTEMPNQMFCMLSTERPLQSTCCLTSYHRSIGDLWILDATVCWRSYGLSSARVVGCTLSALEMNNRCIKTCCFFSWLIFIATLSDP
jgi:hypothetical protein